MWEDKSNLWRKSVGGGAAASILHGPSSALLSTEATPDLFSRKERDTMFLDSLVSFVTMDDDRNEDLAQEDFDNDDDDEAEENRRADTARQDGSCCLVGNS